MTYLVMSKRKLLQLVKEKLVSGWDDPRMPTISGMRRRGYTPTSIQLFAKRIGVSKAESIIEYDILENCVREDLDGVAHRAMAVLDPIKVVIENYPEGSEEEIESPVHPKKAEMGNRTLFFSREIFIDRVDFMENPTPDFFRLAPGREVRLRNAYVIKCKEVIKDPQGKITELRCDYDVATLGGKPTSDGRKVKAVIHWVSVAKSIPAEVRIYGRLFNVADPENVPEGKDFKENLNPDSLKIVRTARLEWSLKGMNTELRYQFERVGYFCLDKDSNPSSLVLNRIVELATGR
jgi:glutaminyl-tRNA synthetase